MQMALMSKPWDGIITLRRNFIFLLQQAISPLRVKDEIDIIGMAPEDECEREMFVTMRWERDGLAVPLSQLTPISETPAETIEAVEDWHYWVKMGYKFC